MYDYEYYQLLSQKVATSKQTFFHKQSCWQARETDFKCKRHNLFMRSSARRKLFDIRTKTSRPIILGDFRPRGSWLRPSVLANKKVLMKQGKLAKEDLTQTVLFAKNLPESRRYVPIGHLKMQLFDYTGPRARNLPKEFASYKITPDAKTKLMYLSLFFPKDFLKRPHVLDRKGIGQAALRRLIEIGEAATKKGETMHILCTTPRKPAQRTFKKAGFKEVNRYSSKELFFKVYKYTIKK